MTARAKAPIARRFLQKITHDGPFVIETPCWRWHGAKTPFGHGVISRGRRGESVPKAHRVSWELHRGDIPDGMVVCHRCDNPQCTNPEHLFLGTQVDNIHDMFAKGRGVNPPRTIRRAS